MPAALAQPKWPYLMIDALLSKKVPLAIGAIRFFCSGACRDSSPQKVVPLTQHKAAILRDFLGTADIEVAHHGYSHQTLPQVREHTEFRGLHCHGQMVTAGEAIELVDDLSFDRPIDNSFFYQKLRLVPSVPGREPRSC